MIKTNCELPFELLTQHNLSLNDMDFVLFHLCESDADYLSYYKGLRKAFPKRVMILDNSAYEYFVKGKKLDIPAYKKMIEELNPTYYILPDVLMDKDTTIAGIKEFMSGELPKGTSEPMAVLQGHTEQEMIECLALYKVNGLRNICIPFHNSFFKELGSQPGDIRREFFNYFNDMNEDLEYAIGRVEFVQKYREQLEACDYVHFLGSHNPFEIHWYKDFDSMDTGYPVKMGIEGRGMFSIKKPNIIIDDFLYNHISEQTTNQIIENIGVFKRYVVCYLGGQC